MKSCQPPIQDRADIGSSLASNPLADNAKVLIGGKDRQLSDLKPGMVVEIVLTTDKKKVVGIKVLHD